MYYSVGAIPTAPSAGYSASERREREKRVGHTKQSAGSHFLDPIPRRLTAAECAAGCPPWAGNAVPRWLFPDLLLSAFNTGAAAWHSSRLAGKNAWHVVGCNSVGYPAEVTTSVACDAAQNMASHSFHAPGANPARQRETTPHPALCLTRRTLPPVGTTAPRHCCP